MKRTTLRVHGIVLVLFLITRTLAANDNATGLLARITLPNGTSRTLELEGVGCSISICSRTVIKGQAKDGSLVEIHLDTLAAIKRATSGGASFVLKNGTELHLSLLRDFRVLYVANRANRQGVEKIDLATVKAIEFLR